MRLLCSLLQNDYHELKLLMIKFSVKDDDVRRGLIVININLFITGDNCLMTVTYSPRILASESEWYIF